MLFSLVGLPIYIPTQKGTSAPCSLFSTSSTVANIFVFLIAIWQVWGDIVDLIYISWLLSFKSKKL